MHSDEGAYFDTVVVLQGEEIEPQVSWGTSPEMVIPVSQAVPTLEQAKDEVQRNDWNRAYQYMGLNAGQALAEIQLDAYLSVRAPTRVLKISVLQPK